MVDDDQAEHGLGAVPCLFGGAPPENGEPLAMVAHEPDVFAHADTRAPRSFLAGQADLGLLHISPHGYQVSSERGGRFPGGGDQHREASASDLDAHGERKASAVIVGTADQGGNVLCLDVATEGGRDLGVEG